MTAGIQIYNSHGTLQIDENYRNMFLAGSGTGNSATITGVTYPLISIRSGGWATVYGAAGSGTATYTMHGNPQWWAWDLRSGGSGSTAGFQVFNASGQLVFDAGHKPMRIVDVRTFSSASQWEGLSLTYPAGRTYATVFSRSAGRGTRQMISKGTDGFEIEVKGWRAGCYWSGTTCTFGWVLVTDYTYFDDSPMWSGDTTETNGVWQVMIVDVTGF